MCESFFSFHRSLFQNYVFNFLVEYNSSLISNNIRLKFGENCSSGDCQERSRKISWRYRNPSIKNSWRAKCVGDLLWRLSLRVIETRNEFSRPTTYAACTEPAAIVEAKKEFSSEKSLSWIEFFALICTRRSPDKSNWIAHLLKIRELFDFFLHINKRRFFPFPWSFSSSSAPIIDCSEISSRGICVGASTFDA